MTKIPFGKYKGMYVEDVIEKDISYFVWLTTIELRGKLKDEVEQLKVVYKREVDEYEQDEYEENYCSGLNWYDMFD